MTLNPSLPTSLFQQLAVLSAGVRSGLPAGPLLQAIKDQAPLPEEASALLDQMGQDLKALQEGRAGSGSLPSPLLRELTQAVDHQVRNAHNVATASLQTGEMELDDLELVLSEMGDTKGLQTLEQVRERMKKAREGILRASSFLDALATLSSPVDAGADPQQTLAQRIAELMNWKPISASATPANASSPASPIKRVSLLYVEDDPDSSELLGMFMERLGFVEAVYRSASFAGAMNVFSKCPALSVLVTDFNLDGPETGLDLARELRRRQPNLRTLFTSGNVEKLKDQMTDEEKRTFLLLEKPLDLGVLERKLEDMIFDGPPQ